MNEQKEPFSLVWLPFGETNKYYLTPDGFEGHLPWFIWGDNLRSFKANGSFELTEECLLKGILYGLSPRIMKVGAGYNEGDLLLILNKLRQGFGYVSDEAFVLNAAYNIKSKNGLLPLPFKMCLLKMVKNLLHSWIKIMRKEHLDQT